MELVIEPTTVPLVSDAHGVVRVGRSRVTLETVIHAFMDGAAAEEIALQFPSLPLADVYATIAYYLQHKAQVDAYLRERDARGRQVQAMIEAADSPVGIRARLLARQTTER